LTFHDPRGFYELTLKGREALGESPPPPKWIDTTRISAAAGRDVQERGSVDDRPSWMKSAHLALGEEKSKGGRPKGSKWDGGALREEQPRLRA
jgi:hypothetical protein